MSALSLAAVLAFAAACPGTGEVPARHLQGTALVESARDPLAIHDNTTGRTYTPASITEAVTLASTLRSAGHSLDAGVMQVNSANWPRLGLNVIRVFDAQANICAGIQVLAEAYRIERRAACRYNTGKPDCANGYPERIAAAEAHIAQGTESSEALVPAAPAASPLPVVIDMLHATTSPAAAPGPPVNMLAAQ